MRIREKEINVKIKGNIFFSKNKILGIFVIMLLVSTALLPAIGMSKFSNKEINEKHPSEIISDETNEFFIDISDYIFSDTLDMALDTSDQSFDEEYEYHIYEGLPWKLYVTAYWVPPEPERNICLWADYSTFPEGAALTPECNCGQGQVTSTFDWIPPIGSAGEYVIVFIGGETCGAPSRYLSITVYVHPYEPEPEITFVMYAGQHYDETVMVKTLPENNICLWADYEALPEGSFFDDCHCGIGAVTSHFIWTPSVDQVGSHIFTTYIGSECGYYDMPVPIEVIVITEDQSPPMVSIDHPADGFVTSNTEVTLTGLITDETGIVSTAGHHEWIGGETMTSGTVDPPETWYSFEWDFTLKEGWNKITISASDGLGLSDEDSVTIYLDTTPPEIEIIAPTNSIYIKDNAFIPFSFPVALGSLTIEADAVDDLSGIDRVVFSVDEEIQAGDCEEPYNWKWGDTYFGKHTVTIGAYDNVGNYVEVDQEVFIINWRGETTDIPDPEISSLSNSQYVGGMVRIDVTEANNADDIAFSKFSCFDGLKWKEIGTDDGLFIDKAEYRGGWLAWWDTSLLSSGNYVLRVEMIDSDCYIGYEEIMVKVEKPPVISVYILDYDPETKTTTFDASDSYDPDGTIDEYIWTFYTYPEVSTYTGETVEFDSPENYVNYTLSVELVDNRGVSASELYFNVEDTALEKKFAIEVQEIDNLTENLTAILNEKKALLAGMNPGDPGYAYLHLAINEIEYAIGWLSNCKYWLGQAKYWQQQGSQENEDRCIENAKERLEWVLDDLKDAISYLEKAGEDIANLENNINKLKEKYVRTVCLDGKVWIISEIGPTTHGAYVPVPSDIWICNGGSYYQFRNQSIHIDKDDVFYTDVILHEYDHHFMYKKNYKIDFPGGAHNINEELTGTIPAPGAAPRNETTAKQLAWSEGWASFSACAKNNNSTWNTPNFDWDLETDTAYAGGNEYEIPDSDDCEGAVAGILWDLFDDTPDETNDTGAKVDEVNLSFKTIVAAMNVPRGSKNQSDIHGFYNRLKAVLQAQGKWNAEMERRIRAVFENHGVTP